MCYFNTPYTTSFLPTNKGEREQKEKGQYKVIVCDLPIKEIGL